MEQRSQRPTNENTAEYSQMAALIDIRTRRRIPGRSSQGSRRPEWKTAFDHARGDVIQDRVLASGHIVGENPSGVLRPLQFINLVNLGIADEVVESEYLLALDDDWDGDGSPGYTEPTWQTAVSLLLDIANNYKSISSRRLEHAEILPGSYGNIDFEVRTHKRTLFVSVPADSRESVRYFGRNNTRDTEIRGKSMINPSGEGWLGTWLAGE